MRSAPFAKQTSWGKSTTTTNNWRSDILLFLFCQHKWANIHGRKPPLTSRRSFETIIHSKKRTTEFFAISGVPQSLWIPSRAEWIKSPRKEKVEQPAHASIFLLLFSSAATKDCLGEKVRKVGPSGTNRTHLSDPLEGAERVKHSTQWFLEQLNGHFLKTRAYLTGTYSNVESESQT